MSNLSWALNELRFGKKVKCRYWPSNQFIERKAGRTCFTTQTGSDYYIDAIDDHDNWELFKEVAFTPKPEVSVDTREYFGIEKAMDYMHVGKKVACKKWVDGSCWFGPSSFNWFLCFDKVKQRILDESGNDWDLEDFSTFDKWFLYVDKNEELMKKKDEEIAKLRVQLDRCRASCFMGLTSLRGY